MKLFFVCALLATSILLLEAIPSAKQLYKNVHPRVGNDKVELGGIWKDCSKSDMHLLNS